MSFYSVSCLSVSCRVVKPFAIFMKPLSKHGVSIRTKRMTYSFQCPRVETSNSFVHQSALRVEPENIKYDSIIQTIN